MSPTWFELEIDFSTSASAEMNIGPGAINVALVLFADADRVALNLSSDAATVSTTLSGLTQTGVNSCLACGLSSAGNLLIVNGRPGALQAIVAFTDGVLTGPTQTDTLAIAQALFNGTEIHTFVVGIQDPAQRDLTFLSELALEGGGHAVVDVSDVGSFNAEFDAFAPAPVPILGPVGGSLLVGLLSAVGAGLLARRRLR